MSRRLQPYQTSESAVELALTSLLAESENGWDSRRILRSLRLSVHPGCMYSCRFPRRQCITGLHHYTHLHCHPHHRTLRYSLYANRAAQAASRDGTSVLFTDEHRLRSSP